MYCPSDYRPGDENLRGSPDYDDRGDMEAHEEELKGSIEGLEDDISSLDNDLCHGGLVAADVVELRGFRVELKGLREELADVQADLEPARYQDNEEAEYRFLNEMDRY